VPVVTALRSARAGRLAVEIDGETAFTVSQSLVARRRLHVDRELDRDELAALARDAGCEAALADAHRLLAHRSRSRRELEDRLAAKGHATEIVERTVEGLEGEGLLDDAAFAAALVADKRRLAGWGRTRIAAELAKRGVDRRLADAALGPDDRGEEVERALAVLVRRRVDDPRAERERKRAFDALRRRGFSTAVAYEAVDRWGHADESGEA